MKTGAILALFALFLVGCAKKNDTPEAVKQGVIRDLAAKFDMQKMDITVGAVSFRDNEADATVTFTVKGMPADQGGMTMKYVMGRREDGQWYIKTRAASDSGVTTVGAHGTTALPPGHPPAGETK